MIDQAEILARMRSSALTALSWCEAGIDDHGPVEDAVLASMVVARDDLVARIAKLDAELERVAPQRRISAEPSAFMRAQ